MAPIAQSPLDACRGRGQIVTIRIRTSNIRHTSQTKKIRHIKSVSVIGGNGK